MDTRGLLVQKFSFAHFWSRIDSLPNDKILDATKLKAFADDKINLVQLMISVFDRVENIVGKGENAGYQHFLLFPQCFQKTSFLGVVKSQDCVVKSLLSSLQQFNPLLSVIIVVMAIKQESCQTFWKNIFWYHSCRKQQLPFPKQQVMDSSKMTVCR